VSATDAHADVASIARGWQLLGSDGEMVGTIDGVGANYFLVRHRTPYAADIYVPMAAISDVDPVAATAVIDVAAYQVGERGWRTPPDDLVGGWEPRE
jgi:hypothetical protein